MAAAKKGQRRKSLRVDKTFPQPVGRIALASGTDNGKTHKSYVAMLDALWSSGRVDILQAIKQRVVTIPEVWDLYRPKHGKTADLGQLPSPETRRRLFKVADDDAAAVGTPADDGVLALWLRGKDCSDTHRDNLARDARQLARLASRSTAIVADLPVLLAKVRARCLKATPQKRQTYNAVRVTVLGFLKETIGRAHHLYGQILDTEPLKRKAKPGHPMEPAEARAFCAYLDAHAPGVGRALWAMCCTGMGPREYYDTPWRVMPDRVRIEGTKRESRLRDVPMVDAGALAEGTHSTRSTLETRIYQACSAPDMASSTFAGEPLWPIKHTPYDGRRTFAHWMAGAGIERARRIAYMGHGAADMTDLYERHEVELHLIGDAAKLRAFIGLDDAPGLRLVSTEAQP